ncbi:unnamed protein product, partial [Symbiodinium pilosum]
MREGGVLIAEVPDKNVDLKTTSKYNDVLAPVLKRMREVANRKLPAIEFIREEVFKLLQLSKREPEEKHVIEFSRVIRKNLSFVKMKARRNEPSEALVDMINEMKAKKEAEKAAAGKDPQASEDDESDDDDGDGPAGNDLCGLLNEFTTSAKAVVAGSQFESQPLEAEPEDANTAKPVKVEMVEDSPPPSSEGVGVAAT